MPLATAVKRMKRLKTAMGGFWKELAWILVWRRSRLGLAPRRLGIDRGTPSNARGPENRSNPKQIQEAMAFTRFWPEIC
jgi:hypothetical protein